MNYVRKFFTLLICATAVVVGFFCYSVSRRTPTFAYQAMIKLFCITKGRSNDFMSRLVGLVNRCYRFEQATGTLGDMSNTTHRDAVVSQLRNRGYYVFERAVPPDMCDRLMRFATTQPSKTRIMQDGKAGEPVSAVYARERPLAIRYDFDPTDLLANEDVQKLLADHSFAALAQSYLGSRPVIDVLAMWWHTAYSDQPDAQAAQFFHFDMDRPKWLKFFIYLTDVRSENGPHSFVAGSHRTGGIPGHLLSKGYSRLTDDEVGRAYNSSDLIEFAAPRGSIIAEDTRGLHKGKHVEKGDRLMLQIQFSNSLFGGEYTKATLSERMLPALREKINRFKHLYTAYT